MFKLDQTYRSVLAVFFVVIITQMVVFQSMHKMHHHAIQLSNHSDSDLSFTDDTTHDHSDCALCLFQLEPFDFSSTDLELDRLIAEYGELNSPISNLFDCLSRTSTLLRGPPSSILL